MKETVLKWGSQANTWLYLFLAYPLIDYLLRNILPIPVVSSLWDEVLLIILLVFTLLAYLEGNRTMPKIKHVLSALFVLGIALTVTDMAVWKASVEGFRSIYQYLIAFFMGFYLLKSVDQLEKLLKVLVLIGFVTGLYGVVQVVLGVQTPGSWVQEGEAITTRAFSFVTSPNVLGSYMALIAPIATGLFIKVTNRKEKLLWAGVTLVTLLALLLTASRGAWFALAFSLFICVYIWKKRVALILVLAGIIGVIGLYNVPDSVPGLGSLKNRVFGIFTPEYIDASLKAGRLDRWGDAYDKMRIEPLFGVGLGHHGGAVGYRHFGTIYSDSYFFKSLAEFGLIGITLLLIFVTMMLRNGVKAVRAWRNSPHFFLFLGLFCGIFAVALHNFVENIFEVPFMALYFWLFGGIFSALYADHIQSKRG
ncbi:MAG TPA: O-antigen ligase family protein [Brevibacillus sp.]|nr:O-antigen ligase family protein [Brevibacillus sp.]